MSSFSFSLIKHKKALTVMPERGRGKRPIVYRRRRRDDVEKQEPAKKCKRLARYSWGLTAREIVRRRSLWMTRPTSVSQPSLARALGALFYLFDGN